MSSDHTGPDLLTLEAVTKVHVQGAVQVHALRGVDLALRPGELVAVMGPSGSGKSTLLHLAGGLDTPTAGSVVLDGVSLAGMSARARAALRRRTVGYVFQDLNLLPALTAAENVVLPRELDGMPTRQARREAREALAAVDVEDLADRYPDEMSGGQQQRVAIARALVGAPAHRPRRRTDGGRGHDERGADPAPAPGTGRRGRRRPAGDARGPACGVG